MELIKKQKGYLTFLVGKPQTGKTSIALADAISLPEKEDILFIEIEMWSRMALKRLVNYHGYSLDNPSSINIFTPNRENMTIESIIDLIRISGASYVYIDYLGLIGGKTKPDNRLEEIKLIIDKLCKLTTDKNISIILLSMAARGPRKEEPINLEGAVNSSKKLFVDNANVIQMFTQRKDWGNHKIDVILYSNNEGFINYSSYILDKSL